MTPVRSLLLAPILALALVAPARATKPRVHLERVDLADVLAGKKDAELRLYASAVELEGQVIDDLAAPQFTLLVDGKAVGHALKTQRFDAANEEMDVVVVVEVGAQYKKELDAIKAALKEFLGEDPPRRMRASLVPFGSDFDPPKPLQPAQAVADQVDDLGADDDSANLRMVDALNAGLVQLTKLGPAQPGGPPPRRALVLISDGLNSRMDRPTFRTLGERAGKAGIPIHTIAFSPNDDRGPLLNLGELSKRSNGTFRWAQKAADLKAQFATLSDEMKKQYVVTFKAEKLEAPDKRTYRLRCPSGDETIVSNALGGAGEFATQVASAPAKGFFEEHGTIVYSVGGGFLGLALLGLIIVVLRNRAARMPPRVVKPTAKMAAQPRSAVAAPAASSRPSAPAAAAPTTANAMTMIAIGGAMAGQRIPVRGTLLVGKGPGLPLMVTDDPTVSTRHCEITFDPRGSQVTDLQSTNGTFVNNTRVQGTHRLTDGDIVRLGASTQFKIRID